MQLYLAVASKAFRRSSTYRLATVTGIVVNSFFGYIYCAVYLAVYASVNNQAVAGLSVAGIVSYLWFSQALIAPTQIWLNRELAQTIYSGAAVSDFSKPFDYQTFWYSRFLGTAFFGFLFRAIPTYLVGWLFFGAVFPKQLATVPLFLLSLILAVSIAFLTNYLVNISAFWLLNSTGAFSIGAGVQMLFSGFLIPLSYMPDWLANLCYFLPFHGIINVPARIWLEQEQSLSALVPQLLWLGLLWVLAHYLTGRAFRKITIQGG